MRTLVASIILLATVTAAAAGECVRIAPTWPFGGGEWRCNPSVEYNSGPGETVSCATAPEVCAFFNVLPSLEDQPLAHAFACGYVLGRHIDSGYPLQSSCDDLNDLAARHGFK